MIILPFRSQGFKSMRRARSSRRGFTMVELIIAAIVNMVVGIGALSILICAAKLQRDIYNYNLVQAEARKIENWLVTDVRNAITLENSVTVNGTTYTSDDHTLILRLPAIDNMGVPVDLKPDPASSASDFVVYYHDADGKLHRLLSRNPNSWRDNRNTALEDRMLAESADSGVVHNSAFSVAPGILGPIVLHYEFRSTRDRSHQGKSPYEVATAGSVYLRNHP